MGLIFRSRRKVAPGVTANVSKHGMSLSEKVGPVTLNSRGRVTVRLGKGLSFRFGRR
ncbi:DUF4236 domain-containing protein [Curtobacterium sp. ISL-83]|uniref:DUF4236 domain-containing protein n=1 Tax=Curtobacterium sp. ISL-83 TaxID=2819145 RepID=UPI001BE9CD94|nr:DUF4236 domain-containing protein [Curtobacterium sp. ISL-83]MBT2501410.1 DUF4236 domain-containing protein [Curtobacterium sp. ISL-83]